MLHLAWFYTSFRSVASISMQWMPRGCSTDLSVDLLWSSSRTSPPETFTHLVLKTSPAVIRLVPRRRAATSCQPAVFLLAQLASRFCAIWISLFKLQTSSRACPVTLSNKALPLREEDKDEEDKEEDEEENEEEAARGRRRWIRRWIGRGSIWPVSEVLLGKPRGANPTWVTLRSCESV